MAGGKLAWGRQMKHARQEGQDNNRGPHRRCTTKPATTRPFSRVDAAANTYGSGGVRHSLWDWDSNFYGRLEGLCSSLPCHQQCLAVSVGLSKDPVPGEELLGANVHKILSSRENPTHPHGGCEAILNTGDASSPNPVFTKAQ